MKKRTSKRLLALILCVTMIFGLAACGKKDGKETNSTNDVNNNRRTE